MKSPLRFPMEPVRDRYVSPFGGVSPDLTAGEVGLNAEALENNTKLVPHEDQVFVMSDLDGRARPLFSRPLFRVVALGKERPDALRHSPEGEVVFSSDDFGGSHDSIFDVLREGAYIVLNATLAERFRQKPGLRGLDAVFAPRRFVSTDE